MTTRRLFLAAVFSLLSFLPAASAAPAQDVSGTWKWTIERNGETQEITLTTKQEDNKVTGKIAGPQGRQIDIHNGQVSDEGIFTFSIDLERNGNTMKIDFRGKVQGDKIDGKTEYTNRDGERRDIDWNARREAKKGRDLTGKWNSSFKRPDGNPIESTLILKQNSESLTGKNEFNGNEAEIREGKAEGNNVSFKLVRERNGRTVTSKFTGKLQKDGTIKGTMESDWTGQTRQLDWEARREQQ
jgi:hypothetical protein